MITVSQVENTLLPFLGTSMLISLKSQCEQTARWLSSPRDRQNLTALSKRISLLFYGQIKRLTEGKMIVLPDGGYPVEMRTEDFYVMADDLLFLLFNDFPADAEHLLMIREYSMQEASLSALRALYTRFAPLQTKSELRTICQIVRSCYPPYRFRDWLNP